MPQRDAPCLKLARSSVEGFGLFAVHDIAPGTFVAEYTGAQPLHSQQPAAEAVPKLCPAP